MKRGRGGRGIVKLQKKKKEKKNNIVPNEDVLFEILLRLPASSVLRLRRVCKSWHSLTTDPYFVRKHTRRHCDNSATATAPKSLLIQYDPSIFPSPSLTLCILSAIVLHRNRILPKFIRMPVKSGYPIDGRLAQLLFCDGLLCFSSAQGPNPYYICNPVTKTWTSVAESLHNRRHTDLIGFYFHRSTGEYRLLQYFQSGKPTTGHIEIGYEVATVNGAEHKSWRTIYRRCYPNNASAVRSGVKAHRLLAADIFWLELGFQFINGNLHWLLFDRWRDVGILVFDTSIEKFISISMPFKLYRHSLLPTLHEIGGNLCIGRPIGLGQKFELWLLKDQEWVKMHSIVLSDQGITRWPSEGPCGEHSFFLRSRTSDLLSYTD